ncbi:hypothetical protein FRC11_007542 [Ceratobasidium sp. 423]|nr:hypothetical protein FRC11_007542 [Ceratobasidium sp. 423]
MAPRKKATRGGSAAKRATRQSLRKKPQATTVTNRNNSPIESPTPSSSRPRPKMRPVPAPDTHIGGMAGEAKKRASEHKDDSSEYGEEEIDKPVLKKVRIHIGNQDVPNEPVGEDEDVDELIEPTD